MPLFPRYRSGLSLLFTLVRHLFSLPSYDIFGSSNRAPFRTRFFTSFFHRRGADPDVASFSFQALFLNVGPIFDVQIRGSPFLFLPSVWPTTAFPLKG